MHFLTKSYIITIQISFWHLFVRKTVFRKIDFSLYFKILLGQWEWVILDIPYGLFGVFSPILPLKNPYSPTSLHCSLSKYLTAQDTRGTPTLPKHNRILTRLGILLQPRSTIKVDKGFFCQLY